MINTIIDLLKSENIEHYLINEQNTESAELFFVRHRLDMRREKAVRNIEVTVYRDFEKDGKKMRGFAVANIFPTMTPDEIAKTLNDAYYAAQFVCNPWYEFAEPTENESERKVCDMPINEAAERMVDALYSVHEDETAFINSAEIFAQKSNIRIISSWGVNVGYVKYTVKGEFVTQCVEHEDVEMYFDFSYDEPDAEQLRIKAENAIEAVMARSGAENCLKDGKYDVILSGENVGVLMSYYVGRAASSVIYSKYSDYSVGVKVQGDSVSGELLNIDAEAAVPYSSEGICMTDRKLIENGELRMIHGATRFCRYLGIEPTGSYGKIRLNNGTVSLENMKSRPYLHVVSFSDFQCDTLTGHFGGEIRLAYWFDGNCVRAVTGGSVNGMITAVHGSYSFTTEKYADADYSGPFAVRLSDVNVAGTVK